MKENIYISGFADEISPDFTEQLKTVTSLGMHYISLRSADGKNIAEYTPDEVREKLMPRLAQYGVKVSSIGSPVGKVGVEDEAGFADCDSNPYYNDVKALAEKEQAQVLPICAKLEEDIAQLDDPDERAMFLEDLGVEQSGLDRLIQCSYELLGLISFLTYGKDECRAWTIRKGTKAPQAAGKIHSDIERGFIRAETINFDEMMACGSVAAAKEKGLLRSEGKDYVVKDGDMIYFRFNV